MNELEKIFNTYMSDKENDSEEIVTLDEKIGTYMKKFELKKEEYSNFEALLIDSNIEYERQGFVNGFKYAVKLLGSII